MKVVLIDFAFTRSKRGAHLTRALLSKGHTVCYIINAPIYGGRRKRPVRGKLSVIEVPNPRKLLPWKGILPRLIIQLLNSFLFLLTIIRRLRELRDADLVITGDMHPFVDLPALFLKKVGRALLVMDIRDSVVEDLALFIPNKLLLSLASSVGLKLMVESAQLVVAGQRTRRPSLRLRCT